MHPYRAFAALPMPKAGGQVTKRKTKLECTVPVLAGKQDSEQSTELRFLLGLLKTSLECLQRLLETLQRSQPDS